MPANTSAEAIGAAISERRAVLFCGAGISVDPPATLPDWKTLRDETIKAVASSEASLAGMLPALLAQDVSRAAGQGLAPELVATTISAVVPGYFTSLRVLDHDTPNRNHALIARLARGGFARYVVSTNFDQLIERALTNEGVEFRVVRSDAEFAAFDSAAAGASTVLFKLHGCISDPGTIVATVEQEAVGLSPQKRALLRRLWDDYTGLFWGYSGADLKIDLDYLQMVAAAPTAKGFIWNLFARGAYREEPNPLVQQLVALYTGRGLVCHEALPDLLGTLVALEPAAAVDPEAVASLKRDRTASLTEALRAWAAECVRSTSACEIFGRLHERTRAFADALTCYQRMADLAVAEKRNALSALAYARGGDLLQRMGRLEDIAHVIDHADQHARSAGALDLDLIVARTRAQTHLAAGDMPGSIQPRAFARLLARWVAPAAVADIQNVELDVADLLMDQRLPQAALELCRTVEDAARRAGRLVQVAEALSRRGRLHDRAGDPGVGAQCLRQSAEIARMLGMTTDAGLAELWAHLVEWRAGTADSPPGGVVDATLAAAHRTENTRLLCELMLEIVEAFEVEPSSLSELTSRLRQYVADGGHHLAIRLAVQESRLFRAIGQPDEERAAIDRVLPLLSRVGNEAAAVELYGRRAALQDVVGGAPAEALRDLENEIAITRRTLGFSREREAALAHLRVRAGRITGVPAFAEFVDIWRTHIGEAEQLVAMVAASAQLSSGTDLDEAFAELVGVEGRFPYLLFQTAALCNQWREAGQPEVALAVATASVPMAAVLGDCQIAGILHNECGLDQMKLKQPDAAFQHFTAAMAEAEAAGDLAGLYDDIFNASEAAQASKQFDRSLELLDRAQPLVEARQDLRGQMAVSVSRGDACRELGRHREAQEHFARAEWYARTLSDRRKTDYCAMRLGKLYWSLQEFEPSIRYRHQMMESLVAKGDKNSGASFAFLIANTYDRNLQRAGDATVYYEAALNALGQGTAGTFDVSEARARLEACRVLAKDVTGLWDLLLKCHDDPAAAERTAARLAMTVDFNLWRFEPRSFCAWFERSFGTLPPPSGQQSSAPVWPVVAVQQLTSLGRSSRDLRDLADASLCFTLANRMAGHLGMPVLAAEARAELQLGNTA